MRRSHESAVICEVGMVGNERSFNLKCAFMNPKAQRKKRDYCKIQSKNRSKLYITCPKEGNEMDNQSFFPIKRGKEGYFAFHFRFFMV